MKVTMDIHVEKLVDWIRGNVDDDEIFDLIDELNNCVCTWEFSLRCLKYFARAIKDVSEDDLEYQEILEELKKI